MPMPSSRPLLVWLLAPSLAVAACSGGTDVGNAESALAENYLVPLRDSGLTATVLDSCRYAGDPDAPWHLSVSVGVDGHPTQVADVLERHGVLVKPHGGFLIIQQRPGRPNEGWDGTLRGDGESAASLDLVMHDVPVEAPLDEPGWAEECTGSVAAD